MSEKLLGDYVEDAAKALRLDKIRNEYERLTKQKCNCNGRKARLNQLHLQFRALTGSDL